MAQLYFHLAPKAEVGVIAKALVRLLRSHRSVAPGLWFPNPPPQLVGPMGNPKTCPAQSWGGNVMVAPARWWVNSTSFSQGLAEGSDPAPPS